MTGVRDDSDSPQKLTVLKQPEKLQPDALALAKELLEIERKRVEVDEKKTEVQRLYIEKSDDESKRQHELALNRYNLGKHIAIYSGIFVFMLAFILLYFSFLGNADQSTHAIQCLQVLMVGVGGYGVISGISGLIKKLFD